MRRAAGLRQRQKQSRKERIFDEAMRLFRERGFSRTTVVDIARAAGVSRGTVFNYYPYKEAFLLEHAAGRLRDLERRIECELSGSCTPLDALYLVARDLAGFVAADRALFLPLGYELLNPDPARSRAAYEALPLAGIVASILDLGQVQGCIRQDFSRERLARGLANALFLTALQWAAYRPEREVQEELRKALALALEGMMTKAEGKKRT